MSRIYIHILELLLYEKGEIIPDADICLVLDVRFENLPVHITRRSLAHILQKRVVGISLLFILEKVIVTFDSLFLSTKGGKDKPRYILFKKEALGIRDVAVVLEMNSEDKTVFVITAMIADYKYLSRKYKKLR